MLPSSRSARHCGPTSGSCSTRIGVMARSSGTTRTTPAPARPRARQRPEEERRGEEVGCSPSVAPSSGAAVEKTPKPLPPPPHARIVQPRRSAPLACGGREGVSGFRVLGAVELKVREGRGGYLQPLQEGFELGLVGGGCHCGVRRIARVKSEMEGAPGSARKRACDRLLANGV